VAQPQDGDAMNELRVSLLAAATLRVPDGYEQPR